jgi:hypothetical protein
MEMIEGKGVENNENQKFYKSCLRKLWKCD